MDTAKLELLRGTLDVLILKALVWGPLHGYAVTNFIRRQSDDALLVEEGTLYPALWRLESKGFLEAEWGLSDNNRKARYSSLPNAGRRQSSGCDSAIQTGNHVRKIPMWRRHDRILGPDPKADFKAELRFHIE